MTQPSAPTTVWIVDNDLGFVWWLGEIFTEAGCRALPALSCGQAVSLLKSLPVGIDLLVLNPLLPGVDGMLRTLRRSYSNFKVIVIGDSSLALSPSIRPQAFLERPLDADPISRAEWLNNVRKLLREVAAAAAAV